MSNNWTEEQWQAITALGQDTLVAAAAGSGKTAVLVERIIKRITDEADPLDVDRILVVTFTDAASAEMRKRIGEALEKELNKNPGSESLKRQLNLINNASISTFHSFCLSVLRRYYYLTDLDPGFRIADSTEIELLKEEVLDDLFESEYKKSEVDFFHLVDCYSTDRSDADIQKLVLKLAEFARSNPWPENWLEEMKNSYQISPDSSIDQLPWAQELLRAIVSRIRGMEGQLLKALKIIEKPGGPTPYVENLQDDLILINDLITAGEASWEALYTSIQDLKFSNLKRIKKDECDDELKERVQKLRNKVKEQVKKLEDEFFSRPPKSYIEDLNKMAPIVARLVKLVNDFSKSYQQEKNHRGLVDYSDLEHYCLKILLAAESTPKNPVPSRAAIDYQAKFSEVLVDEYQDTNMVQETILQLVTKSEGEAGNLFMVGDVKQSIYRFRLAEPELFLEKYKAFCRRGEAGGLLIDLAKNFRSRSQVLDGTNFIFKQIMNEAVGEIEYNQDAELVRGAEDYPESKNTHPELLVIDREGGGNSLEVEEEDELDEAELEAVELEAKLLAEKIRELIGTEEGVEPFQVYEKGVKALRPVKYRDIVILLRTSKNWAPVILEELKQQGIPAYAELDSGYFEATEVAVVMSLLKVIDNPYQDIPLASVLRSPVVGLSGEELAKIRIEENEASYYEAVIRYLDLCQADRDEELYGKLVSFIEKLRCWRTDARQGDLSELIWKTYRQTGYYDLVAGIPGGNQRQANLRALYDRARQYEKTSFRGLFRFLRFIERLRDRGGDFGSARALGEQEDVVRLMTVHKSKGLEFPVVFLAGMGKQFNFQDLKGRFLLHKKLGFGTKRIDPEARISFAAFPQLAIRERQRLELIAEEMRLLYVALTRAKEKLYLIGTVKDLEKEIEKWQEQLSCDTWLLPEVERSNCKSYLDWVGRALIRHRDGKCLRIPGQEEEIFKEVYQHPSCWSINSYDARSFARVEKIEEERIGDDIKAAIKSCEPVALESDQKYKVARRLEWSYPHNLATNHMSKQTVTEIKHHWEMIDDEGMMRVANLPRPMLERPSFLQGEELSPAERGTVMHQLMQHFDFTKPVTDEEVRHQVEQMVEQELLTAKQAEVVDIAGTVRFFASDIGARMKAADRVEREIPFSLAQPAEEIYKDWTGAESELVLVQGVIDCVIFEQGGLVILDYKTDKIGGRYPGGFNEAEPIMKERYQIQLKFYTRAIERIWKKQVKENYLYFFDGGHLLQM